MPELPEVETSCRGIAPWVENEEIHSVIIRERRLRWPVSEEIELELPGKTIQSVQRRAKYILFATASGTAMLHLGMSGSVRIIDWDEPAGKHDHFDIRFKNGNALRFRDLRRFGSFLWAANPFEHRLLRNLGPEPLSTAFNGEYLWMKSRGRKVSIKQFIMNGSIVVGVGNIYASEALFSSGIHPKRRAGRIALSRMVTLVDAIKEVLQSAIKAGGTTLRDFSAGDGSPGYFKRQLNVYDRANQPCRSCQTPLSAAVLGQRSTFYCKICQR